ncbi:MAG: hypothetical protein IIC76_10580 [Bacteroidetes bacterium]|nr:hypothetical protein [Bacteroidota bacterium]
MLNFFIFFEPKLKICSNCQFITGFHQESNLIM